jgi:hypothetical protein
MKNKILVAALANLLLVGAVYADQFLTKADERNNVVSPGDQEINGGGSSCGTAVAITSLPFADAGTTVGATNTNGTLPAGCSNYTTVAGPDVIYTFTTGAGASVSISSTTTGSYDGAIYVLGTCGNSATCVTGEDAVIGPGTETISAFAFAPGTYGLYVDSFYAVGNGQESGPFNLNVSGTLPVEVTNFNVE